MREEPGILADFIKRALAEEAERTGLSVEEIRRQGQKAAENAAEETRQKRKAEAVERERRLLQATGCPDGAVPATKTALNRVIRWTSSRYNPLRKGEVVARLQEAIDSADAPGDLPGASCVRSATYSCGSFTPSSAMNAGSTYELRVTGKGAFLIADFGGPGQRVYEILRASRTQRRCFEEEIH